jgi:hypothetical protein
MSVRDELTTAQREAETPAAKRYALLMTRDCVDTTHDMRHLQVEPLDDAWLFYCTKCLLIVDSKGEEYPGA